MGVVSDNLSGHRFFRTLGVVVFLIGTSGCGGKGGKAGAQDEPGVCSDGTEPFGDGHLELPFEPSETGVLTLRINPFAGPNQLGVAWVPPGDKALGESLVLSPPATVEGYHWAWSPKQTAPLWLASAEGWQSRCKSALGELSGVVGATAGVHRAIGFGLDFANPASSAAWPAVVGLGDDASRVLSLVALAPVMPAASGAPLRVEFQQAQTPNLVVYTKAKSCGPLCFEYQNFLEAMDTPFVVTRDDSEVFVGSSSQGNVRMVAVSRSEESGELPTSRQVTDSCRATWQNAVQRAGDVFSYLGTLWPVPEAVASGYDIYLTHRAGLTTYQGLEHSGSTLISVVGDCNSASYQHVLDKVIAHEIVHVWNVRHLFPAEHAMIDFGAFSQDRLRQLYLYEGWTESYARVALAEQGAVEPASAAAEWNNSLAALYRGFEGAPDGQTLVFDRVDGNNAFGQYQTGAALLLYLGLQLRSQLDEATARSRFWDLLPRLRVRADGSARESSFARPPWLRRVWDGVKGSIGDPAAWGIGYTSGHVAALIKETVGSENRSTPDQVVLTREAFEQTLDSYAAATGVRFILDSKGHKVVDFGAEASRGALRWPFAPPRL
jgi:hypothetical protein